MPELLDTFWDPGRGFLDLLPDGVGVDEPLIRLAAAPLWSEPLKPLQHCTSAWKSALDHPSIVDELLAALAVELSVGWVRPISSGISALKTQICCWQTGRCFGGGAPPPPPPSPRLTNASLSVPLTKACSVSTEETPFSVVPQLRGTCFWMLLVPPGRYSDPPWPPPEKRWSFSSHLCG